MILIEKSSQNIVALTLTEKTTITGANYIFYFSYYNGDTKIFTVPDTSTATGRYNKFMITETTVEDLYNGEINLEHAGFWDYKIYQTATSSPVDLDDLDDLDEANVVEVGIVKVIGDLTADNVLDPDYVPNINILE